MATIKNALTHWQRTKFYMLLPEEAKPVKLGHNEIRISIEGRPQSGKTTIALLIAETLRKHLRTASISVYEPEYDRPEVLIHQHNAKLKNLGKFVRSVEIISVMHRPKQKPKK